MILQHILASCPTRAYERLRNTLDGMGVDTTVYESMEIEELETKMSALSKIKSEMLSNMSFDMECKDVRYNIMVLETAAIRSLIQEKIEEADSRDLIVGMTYYKNVKSYGSNRIIGKRTTYLGENRCAAWSNFNADVRSLKVIEVLRHGSDKDFLNLYYIMADGRTDAPTRITLEHITKSSNRALEEMGRYCDSKWDGPWPWEAPAPTEIKRIIEMNDKNRRLKLARTSFNKRARAFFEGEVEKSEVIVGGKDMTDKITGMIHDLGKLSAQLMAEFKDKVRTTYGDQAVQGLNDIYGEKINTAVDTLSDLKSSMDRYLQQLSSGQVGMGMDDSGAIADMGMGTDLKKGSDMDFDSEEDGYGDMDKDKADMNLDDFDDAYGKEREKKNSIKKLNKDIKNEK